MNSHLVSSPRSKKGRYVAPKGALIAGAITRREWINFLRKITIGELCQCVIEPSHHHWIWSGSRGAGGYGTLKWRGQSCKAHRFAFVALGGCIPEGKELDHVCRIRHCCNPACIEPVTHIENMARSYGRDITESAIPHCIHGHQLTEKIYRTGTITRRRCLVCDNQRHKQARAARRTS